MLMLTSLGLSSQHFAEQQLGLGMRSSLSGDQNREKMIAFHTPKAAAKLVKYL